MANLIYDLEHGKKRSGYRDFGNRSSLELLATGIDSGLRRSHAKLCALIDVETPLLTLTNCASFRGRIRGGFVLGMTTHNPKSWEKAMIPAAVSTF